MEAAPDGAVDIVPLDRYDSARAKIAANLQWICAKAYGIGGSGRGRGPGFGTAFVRGWPPEPAGRGRGSSGRCRGEERVGRRGSAAARRWVRGWPSCAA